jgi:hypothetical protein
MTTDASPNGAREDEADVVRYETRSRAGQRR